MKRAIKTCSLLLIAFYLVMLATCENPAEDGAGGSQEEEGAFTISIGSSQISRSAVNYPPQSQADLDQLKLTAKFFRGSTLAKTFTSMGDRVSDKVATGTYTVEVEITLLADGTLYASGSSSGTVEIKAGPNPTIKVVVYEAVNVSVSPPTANVNTGISTQLFAATVTGPTTPGVTWSVSGSTLPGTDIDPVTGFLSVDPGESPGTVLTVKATSVGDPTRSGTALATVSSTPTAQAPSIDTHPISAKYDIITGGAVPLTVAASVFDGGTLSHQWYSNTVNSNTGGTPVGTNSASYTPPTSTEGAAYYYCVVTNTSPLPGYDPSSTASNIAVVTVIREVTAILSVPTKTTIGGSLTLSGTVDPPGATNQTITWSIVSGGGTGAILNGAVLSSATTAGTVTVMATISFGSVYGDYTENFDIDVQQPTTFTITFAQIEAAPPITGPTLSRTGAGGNSKYVTINVDGIYDSYDWYLYTIHRTGSSITLSLIPGDTGYDIAYDMIGNHALELVVVKGVSPDDIPYSKTVTFKVIP